MRIENDIALRYILLNRKNKNISNASITVIVSIVVAIVFFICSMSIMNGFIYGLMRIELEVNSFHITYPAYNTYNDSRYLMDKLLSNRRIAGEIRYIGLYRETKVLLNANGKSKGLAFFRVIPEKIFDEDRGFKETIGMLDGTADIGKNKILLSRLVANRLRVRPGDHVYLTAMVVRDSPTVTLERLEVSGIFSTGYAELDGQLAFVGQETGDKIFSNRLEYEIFIKLKDYKKAKFIKMLNEIPPEIDKKSFNEYISGILANTNRRELDYLKKMFRLDGENYVLRDDLKDREIEKTWKILESVGFIPGMNGMVTWEEKNQATLTALNFEKNVIAFIVILVLFVAVLNILTMTYIMIHEKNQDIGILKAVGYSPGKINLIFLINSLYIGFVGIILGVVIGLFIMQWLNEMLTLFSKMLNGFIFMVYFIINIFTKIDFPEKMEIFSKDFYLDRIYTSISFREILVIVILTLIFTVIASILPVVKAGKIKPIEVIKNG